MWFVILHAMAFSESLTDTHIDLILLLKILQPTRCNVNKLVIFADEAFACIKIDQYLNNSHFRISSSLTSHDKPL